MNRFTAFLAIALLSLPAFGQMKYGNADAINADQLRSYLSFIASDDLEGRNTPSRGLDIAAKFIATHLSRWGFKPAGDNGSYFQKIKLRHSFINAAKTSLTIGDRTFAYGPDFLADAQAGTFSGKLVFAGYGYRFKAKDINSFEGLDVKGKIIVKLSGLPPGATFQDFQGKMGEDWDGSVSYGTRNGAIAVIVVGDYGDLSRWDAQVKNQSERGQYAVEQFSEGGEKYIPTITVAPSVLRSLFQGEKLSDVDAFKAVAASGSDVPTFEFKDTKKVSITIGVKEEEAWTQNVVGILEGSDASLKNQYVAIGAHYDHVGIGTTVDGDSIYNGADDDGSGTVSVLSIAEAFAKGPKPKRSILFVWHAGEERGLWGSRYYVDNPTVPLKNVVTQLNIDMVGRSKKEGDMDPRNKELSGPNEVYVIGSKMMSSGLGELSEKVNDSYQKMKFNYTYDDPKDPNRFFFRSDHFNYAQKGIPIIFYFDGVHEDYHQRGDEWQKIDYVKMQKIARTVYATAWELANASKRPEIDKELPPELKEN